MTYDSTVLKVQNTARNEEFKRSYRVIPVVLIASSSTADLPQFAALRLPLGDVCFKPTICVIAPALMRAVFAATGKPVRSLPLKNLILV